MNVEFCPDKIAERVKYVRENIAKLGPCDFAETIHTTGPNVRRWEQGCHLPTAYFLFAICSVYGVSVDWLLGLTDRR